MKKALISMVFLAAANMLFAGGSSWAPNDRVVYDGESEIFFSYTGPEGVLARVYEDGKLLGSLTPGETKRRIVTDGSHTIRVHSGVYNEATKKTVEDPQSSNILIAARKNRSTVKIAISRTNGQNRVRDLALTGAVAIQTQPKAQQNQASGQNQNKETNTIAPPAKPPERTVIASVPVPEKKTVTKPALQRVTVKKATSPNQAPTAPAPPPQPAQTAKTSNAKPMDGAWENQEYRMFVLVDRTLFLMVNTSEGNGTTGVAGEISPARSVIDTGHSSYGLLPYVFSGNKLTLKIVDGRSEIDVVFSRSSKTLDSFNPKTALEGDWTWAAESLSSLGEQKRNRIAGFQRILFRGSWMIFPNSGRKNQNAYTVKISNDQILDADSRVLMSYELSGGALLVVTFPDGTKICYRKEISK
jgi:hypothetical protein